MDGVQTANGMENGTNGYYGRGQNGLQQNGKGDARMSMPGQVGHPDVKKDNHAHTYWLIKSWVLNVISRAAPGDCGAPL